ncbi:hypothetical protein EPI10_000809 [Gossypium australe]|uniref:Reverse transcriptase n=1 Tax=Gossypium australe TaxID=47621 RepID=A0A5B6V939_9ROSI|nr:hypothetical protein EPI10_000809 [Gossypium australe]
MTSCEVSKAFWSLKPHKASGLDGKHPFFFQKCWTMSGINLLGWLRRSVESIKDTIEIFMVQSVLMETKDLRKYIGYPIHTARVFRKDYDFISI